MMNTIRSFTAEDATVIYGSVIDEAIGDALRVTIVATGLGGAAAQRQPGDAVVPRTGTDDEPVAGQLRGARAAAAIRRRRDQTVDACAIRAWTRSTSRRSCASRRTDGRRGGPARRRPAIAGIVRPRGRRVSRRPCPPSLAGPRQAGRFSFPERCGSAAPR